MKSDEDPLSLGECGPNSVNLLFVCFSLARYVHVNYEWTEKGRKEKCRKEKRRIEKDRKKNLEKKKIEREKVRIEKGRRKNIEKKNSERENIEGKVLVGATVLYAFISLV